MILSNSKLMKKADEKAITELKIPSTLLMRRASEHLGRAALAMGNRVYIICGSGNNGGDGVGAAAWLLQRGAEVRCYLAGKRSSMTKDTLEMERRLNEAGGVLEDFSEDTDLSQAQVIVDALFGVGLNREVSGLYAKAIEKINESGVPVISADIPSGVSADTGEILGAAVKAVKTVTFSMAKVGHFTEPGCTMCGDIEVVDIGIPAHVLKDAETGIKLMEDIKLPRRREISHKGDYGKLLVIGGSVGYTGAPSMCAKAAVISGAGLVWLGVPNSIYEITAVKNDEAMPFPLLCDIEGRIALGAETEIERRLQGMDVCVIGPGMGRNLWFKTLVERILESSPCPLVLDADALNAISEDPSVLKKAKYPPVLTPHEGEFARLGGRLTGDRIGDARAFAEQHGCVLVLKGHRTIVAFPDEEVYITKYGNPGMAKGGTGDVLAGVIGALMGQLPLKDAITAAVYIHSLAGDKCRDKMGEYSVTASGIIREIPEVMKNMTE